MLMFALVTMSACSATGGALPPAVWPPPVSASCTGSAGSAFSSHGLNFHFSGHGENSLIAHKASARYLPLLTEGAPASGTIDSISIFVGAAAETLSLDTDYAYEINVNGSEVLLRTRSPFGVAYALETLSQFIVPGTNGAALQCATIAVSDAPAFAHRGLSLDSASGRNPPLSNRESAREH